VISLVVIIIKGSNYDGWDLQSKAVEKGH